MTSTELAPLSMDTVALAQRVRRHVVLMTSRGQSSHVGSCLSVTDILTVLYGTVLRVDPRDPAHPRRDRLVLSKGHAGAAVYATLAECGFFSPALLETHYQNGSKLSGHVSHKGVPGVEVSTGSLGHGLGIGAGLAYSEKLRHTDRRTVVVMSDGECDEGSVWEAALFAGHHKLASLLAVVDYNGLQSLASTTETLDLEPFDAKWRAFGWEVRTTDGHDHEALRNAFRPASDIRPVCVLARTTKGKGVSFMEGSVLWHYRSPQGHELRAALEELAIR